MINCSGKIEQVEVKDEVIPSMQVSNKLNGDILQLQRFNSMDCLINAYYVMQGTSVMKGMKV